jgi:membrane dipeptidase
VESLHSDQIRQFHRDHPICDMLGINLAHPRFLIDDIDLGKRDPTTRRSDFPKLKDWGLSVVMCKGGAAHYDDEYKGFWINDPTRRPGRDSEDLFLSLAIKNPTQLILGGLDRFLINVEAYPDQVVLVRTGADLDRARAAGKIAVLMGANRSDWFGDSPGILRMFARLGLRMITLGQATRELGYDASNETRSGGRMTALGVRMIEEMNRCGILIDLAHTNDPCALDAIEVSATPVVDSHSNPRTLEEGDRSAPDEVMKALAARGGMLGIMPLISRPPGDVPPQEPPPAEEIEQTLRMIRYAVDVMGIDGVGIGTHFNSMVMPWITGALLDAGFSYEDTAKIMGENYLRVLRQVLPAE